MARRQIGWIATGWLVAIVLSACATGRSPTGGSTPAPTPSTGTVVGSAVVDAGCPVVRPGTPCPHVALTRSYAVVATSKVSSSTTRSEATAEGTFRLVLPAGHYSLRGEVPGGIPRGLGLDVDVQAGRTARITLVFDSGVRAASS